MMDSFWEKQRELSLIITKGDVGVGSALKSYSSLFLSLAFLLSFFFFSLSKVVHTSLNSVVCLLSFVIGFLKTWQQKKASPLSEQSKAASLSHFVCVVATKKEGERVSFVVWSLWPHLVITHGNSFSNWGHTYGYNLYMNKSKTCSNFEVAPLNPLVLLHH